jgi:hypothetical protein
MKKRVTFGDRNILYTLFARAREHEGLIQKKREVNSKEPIPFFLGQGHRDAPLKALPQNSRGHYSL